MKGKKTWRLGKTLGRAVTVRPIENDDVKYAWAAYKTGALSQLELTENLDAPGFKDAFEKYVLTNAHAAWTVIANTARGMTPIGFVLGQFGPGFMLITGIAWFPWASRRNVIEGTVGFFRRLNTEMPWFGAASKEHKPVYEVCCMHGIMRRVGTSQHLGMAVFEGHR